MADDTQPALPSGGGGVLQCLWRGFADSLNVVVPVQCLYGSTAVRNSSMACSALNGVFFLGSMLLFNYVLQPLILGLVRPGQPEEAEVFDAWAPVVSACVWNGLFVGPMYLLSCVLSAIYTQEIADAGYKFVRRRRGTHASSSVAQVLSEVIFGFAIQILLLLQASAAGLLPITIGPVQIGSGLRFVCTTWVVSMYSFEYTWINQGLKLKERLAYFERHWAYFIGYGTPVTLCTWWFSLTENAALFAMMLPLFVLTAISAEPLSCDPDKVFLGLAPKSLPICGIPLALSNWLFKRLPQRRAARTRVTR